MGKQTRLISTKELIDLIKKNKKEIIRESERSNLSPSEKQAVNGKADNRGSGS